MLPVYTCLERTLSEAPPSVQLLHYNDARLDSLVRSLGPEMGMDLEWPKDAPEGSIAIITLADRRTILVIQVGECAPDNLPCSIKDVVEDGGRVKVGQGIREDATRLGHRYNVVAKHLVDLSAFAKSVDGSRWLGRGADDCYRDMASAIGLANLCHAYLGAELAKDEHVRCGNWCGVLSEAQKQYAANDAYASLEVFLALERLAAERAPAHERRTNTADFTFNMDAKFLDDISGRTANSDLALFNEMKASRSQRDQDRWQTTTTRNLSTGEWKAQYYLDDYVVATGKHTKKRRALGEAARIAMSSLQWTTWLETSARMSPHA